jgi:hypothetical protein
MVKIYGSQGDTNLAGGALDAHFLFSTTTTEADPGSGHIRFNSASFASTTEIYMSTTDNDGFDQSGVLLLRLNDAFKVDSTSHPDVAAFKLTAAPINNTGWITLPVENVLAVGSFSSNEKVLATAIFSGASDYTDLGDVPNTYTGDAGKLVAVKGTEDGLEHRDLVSGDIPNLDASKITTGTVATTRLGSGTANSTTYLRGDQTWVSVPSGAVTIQSAAPTATTNGTLGQTLYASSDNRFYICTDATTNANNWRGFNSDFQTGIFQFPYPGGTLTNGVAANTEPNKTIADRDILWGLGTNFGTASYTNPIDGTKVIQTNSGVSASFGSPVVLADRLGATTAATAYLSTNASQSWLQFFFPGHNVSLTHIALQQNNGATSYLHRTVSIRYSSDGTNFTQAVSFTASTSSGGWSLIPITGWISNRYLRLVHTSLDNLGQNYFSVVEMLLYGTLTPV